MECFSFGSAGALAVARLETLRTADFDKTLLDSVVQRIRREVWGRRVERHGEAEETAGGEADEDEVDGEEDEDDVDGGAPDVEPEAEDQPEDVGDGDADAEADEDGDEPTS